MVSSYKKQEEIWKGIVSQGPSVRVTTDSPMYGKLNVWEILNCPQNVSEMQWNSSSCSTYLYGGDFLCFWFNKLCYPATFSHTNPLTIFLIFKLLPNFIFQCYRSQMLQFYLFFPALFISGIHKVPGLKFKGGYRSRDQVLQRAKLLLTPKKNMKGSSTQIQ